MLMLWLAGYTLIGLVAALSAKWFGLKQAAAETLSSVVVGIAGSLGGGLFVLASLRLGQLYVYNYGITHVVNEESALTDYWLSLVAGIVGAVLALAVFILIRSRREL